MISRTLNLKLEGKKFPAKAVSPTVRVYAFNDREGADCPKDIFWTKIETKDGVSL